jgi:ribose transport system substrate-binding protein
VIQYDGGGNPSRQNADMLNAISAGANVIANMAIDPNLVQQGLRAAKAHNVLVVSGSSGLSQPNPTISPPAGHLGYAFDVGPDYAAAGAEAADWIISDSKGKADVLVFSDKEFPSVIAFQRGLLAELKKCSGCKTSPLQYFTGAQVTTSLPQQTTGYLQSHPNINYVFSPYDPAAAAQVTAIKQAGLASKVKLVSVLGDQQNVQYIRSGTVQAADAAYDNEYMGYAIVDQIIRTLDHKGISHPIGENLPYSLLTKSNLPAPGSDWHAPYDYKAKFLKLWK